MILLFGCGEVGTGVSNPTTTTTTTETSSSKADAAASVAAIFSGSSSTSTKRMLLKALEDAEYDESDEEGGHDEGSEDRTKAEDGTRSSDCGETDPACTCEEVASGSAGSPTNIEQVGYVVPGEYGSPSEREYLLVVSEGDSCTDSGSTANAGKGPDNLGRVAGFTIKSDVVGKCTRTASAASTGTLDATVTKATEELTITMKQGSTGVWRNTTAALTTVAYEPQIWGTFTMETSEGILEVRCTIFMGSGEEIHFADCADTATGETISQVTSNVDCDFDTE
jgi:hypothetical protein